jgi:hypothetical protein
LKAGNAAPPKPIEPPRPIITHPQPVGIELPTADQCNRLVEVITRRYPALTPRFTRKWADLEEDEFRAAS